MMRKRATNTAAAVSPVEPDVGNRREGLFGPDAGAKPTNTSGPVLTTTSGSDSGFASGLDGATPSNLFLESLRLTDSQSKKHVSGTNANPHPTVGLRVGCAAASSLVLGFSSAPKMGQPRTPSMSAGSDTCEAGSIEASTRNIYQKQTHETTFDLFANPCKPSLGAFEKPVALECNISLGPNRSEAPGWLQMDHYDNTTSSGTVDKSSKGTSTSASSEAGSSSPTPSARRKRGQSSKKIKPKKEDDDHSDSDEPDIAAKGRTGRRKLPTRAWACPLFKSDPSSHIDCMNKWWGLKRKVKAHLKDCHYKNHPLPPEIERSHKWDDWYEYVVRGTDKESRKRPNIDPNFVPIIIYLVKAGEQLGDQDSPCFGTRMLKLFQHTQRNPEEAEAIVQGIKAILSRADEPVESGNEQFAADSSTAPPCTGNPTLGQFGNQDVAIDTCSQWPTGESRLEPGLAPTNDFDCGSVEANEHMLLSNDQTFTLNDSPSHAQGALLYDQHSSVNATGDISQWIATSDFHTNSNISHEVMDGSAMSQNTTCKGRAPETESTTMLHGMAIGLRLGPIPYPGPSYPQGHSASVATATAAASDRIPSEFGDHADLTGFNMQLEVASGLAPRLFPAAPPTNPTTMDAMPAPRFLPSAQHRSNVSTIFAKRKRPRAESMENIRIPALDSRAYPLPTPSPSVYERPQLSSSLMTPLLTPFTAGTTSSITAPSHVILVIAGTRPELFRFTGSISNSIDEFINWLAQTFGFRFDDMKRWCLFINSDDGIVACRQEEVLPQLERFWGEVNVFLSRSIPWFWIDMPCTYNGLLENLMLPYRPNAVVSPLDAVNGLPLTGNNSW
ncbi:hypothetical protein Dda_2470 [Drechslerella dactyloides]|uniref:Uncharacterized protein n=1 Tax=Drechslerella dactyloides TaxID=74499 RepID=A0AAD6J407_DREDA|nr:hypothetical protein Dda_2470 [Drechslerella dactyloides]